ncbi:selenide, water dikinase SelD [Magnetovibrio sp. PR-2]|uniref:selenide, water dikinase SelD n=1 Tax=Magnetovibrio sp. PR-2 TaxID=3120356 RepID=UPI002FCE11A3
MESIAPSLTSLAKAAGCAAKIDQSALAVALSKLPVSNDPRLMVDHSGSDDAAVFKLRDDLALVETVDIFPPIVDDPYDYGRIAATNALSDVYAMGAQPISALSFVAWPVEQLGLDSLGRVLKGAADICAEAGIVIAGGHSIVDQEPKFGLFVTGTVHPDKVTGNVGARPGDVLVLSKKIGTGILTTAVKRGHLPVSGLREAITSMTTLNATAASVATECGVSAVTDVTGFGLLGHLGNMLRASSKDFGQPLGACISYADVPLFDDVEDFLEQGLCPGGTRRNLEHAAPRTSFSVNLSPSQQLLLADAQTSGGLLIAVPENKLDTLLDKMKSEEVSVRAVIGKVTDAECAGSTVIND